MIYHQHRRLSFSIAAALMVMLLTFFFYPFHPILATDRDRWEGQMEEKIRQGEKKDSEILDEIKSMHKKIDGFCSSITEKMHQTQLEMLRTSGAYGAGAGGVIYGIISLLQWGLKRKR